MKVNTIIQAEFFYGASPEIFERARELRKSTTDAEIFLWKKLKAKQICGLQFRRQHPINQFISDFYCHKALLVVEVDGQVHSIPQQYERDQGRDYFMTELGLTVLRFTNQEVMNDIEGVIKRIKDNCCVLDVVPHLGDLGGKKKHNLLPL